MRISFISVLLNSLYLRSRSSLQDIVTDSHMYIYRKPAPMGSSGQSLTKRKDLIRISSGVPHDKSLKGKPCVVDTLFAES